MVSVLAQAACDDGRAGDAQQPPVGTSASASGSGSTSGSSGADPTTFDPEESSSSGTTFEPSTGGVDTVFDPAFAEQQVDALLAAGVPGLAVAVVFDGEVVYAQAHGVTGPDAGSVDASTLFNLASVAKSATAMTLVEQAGAGLFDLQDPVSTHVPSFGAAGPYSAQSVTVHHLLTQSAGLGDWETEPFAGAVTLADSFALNAKQPLWAEPGAVFNYSNRNFELAGLVAATAEGTSFSEAVRSRVLEPSRCSPKRASIDSGSTTSMEHVGARSRFR